ncbi:MAG TPA: alanine racemase [Bacteroidota bacterium]|nr:alanine racemase [Bacteroidota bacterium]
MRRTRAEIDLKALEYNFNGVRNRVGPDVSIMGIVKANAYGHGMIDLARALIRFGCDHLGVGLLEEGIDLRRAGITSPVLVLGGVSASQIDQFLQHNLDITVSSIDGAQQVDAAARQHGGMKARVHLKIDTGMERIGVRAENALPFVEFACHLNHLDVVGIYSHLATSEDPETSFARRQLERFDKVLDGIENSGIEIRHKHIANSGAILNLPESYYTMVRPGIMIYGYSPSRELSPAAGLRPVLSLRSEVIYLKDVPPGTSISYGRKYFTTTATRIATVPIGYGDGYSRRLTNQTEVLIRGGRFPAVGTICMDHLMVDVGLNSGISLGDEVVLIGSQGGEEISAWEISEKLATIPYEVLTGILPRVPRVYIG